MDERTDYKPGFLFDLDGVLIDSERRYTRIWQQIVDKYPTGIDNFPHVIKGMTLYNILDRYYPDPAVREAVEEMCIAAEAHIDYDYMPGAKALLTQLRSMNVPMAMVTSSDKPKMQALRLKLPDLCEWFDAVVDGNMVTKGKPDPEPYLTGARLLGLDPHHCVVIEDSLTGIEAGKRAGALVVGLSDTLGREAIMPKAHITIDSLEELNPQKVINILRAGA